MWDLLSQMFGKKLKLSKKKFLKARGSNESEEFVNPTYLKISFMGERWYFQ